MMMLVLTEILLWDQNSEKILLEKRNCKRNFDMEARVVVVDDVCVKRNSVAISEFYWEKKILCRILFPMDNSVYENVLH